MSRHPKKCVKVEFIGTLKTGEKMERCELGKGKESLGVDQLSLILAKMPEKLSESWINIKGTWCHQ